MKVGLPMVSRMTRQRKQARPGNEGDRSLGEVWCHSYGDWPGWSSSCVVQWLPLEGDTNDHRRTLNPLTTLTNRTFLDIFVVFLSPWLSLPFPIASAPARDGDALWGATMHLCCIWSSSRGCRLWELRQWLTLLRPLPRCLVWHVAYAVLHPVSPKYEDCDFAC